MEAKAKYANEINAVISEINKHLKNDPHFGSVFVYEDSYRKRLDFNGVLKEVPNYAYTSVSIPYKEVHRTDDVLLQFLKSWKKSTREQASIDSFKRFVSSW